MPVNPGAPSSAESPHRFRNGGGGFELTQRAGRRRKSKLGAHYPLRKLGVHCHSPPPPGFRPLIQLSRPEVIGDWSQAPRYFNFLSNHWGGKAKLVYTTLGRAYRLLRDWVPGLSARKVAGESTSSSWCPFPMLQFAHLDGYRQ